MIDRPLSADQRTAVIEAFKILVEEIDATGVYLDGPKDAVKFIGQCVSSALTKLIQQNTASAAQPSPDRALEEVTRPYTADNGHSKGVAADSTGQALGDPCPVCATGRIGQSGYNLRCSNCGWLGPRVEWAP